MSAWTYVEDNPTPPGSAVLVTFVDYQGRRHATIATYFAEHELESTDEDDRCGGVYDEETDKWWASPGWYESSVEDDQYRLLDGEVVAWRPLEVAPERAPAEEPREVAEPKSAVGLVVEELKRREGCPDCAAMAAVLRAYWPVNRRPQELARLLAIYAPTVKESLSVAHDHTEDPLAMVEPAPSPARWRCEGCGAEDIICETVELTRSGWVHWRAESHRDVPCGPVVSAGAAP